MARALLLLLAWLLFAGCVVDDGSAEVHLYPEGPLTANGQDVLVYVETSATGQIRMLLDGGEFGPAVDANSYTSLSLAGRTPGEHTLQARAWDGTRPIESNVLLVTLPAPQ